MPKAYWVTMYRSVSDPAALAAYGEAAGPALKAFGARILARGEPAVALEGASHRTAVVEFDSVDTAVAAYNSPAYQAALKFLTPGAVDRDIRIIEAA